MGQEASSVAVKDGGTEGERDEDLSSFPAFPPESKAWKETGSSERDWGERVYEWINEQCEWTARGNSTALRF